MLEQPQVDSRGIVIVEIPEFALVDELADLLYRPGKEKRMIHHDAEIFLIRQLNELLGLSGVRGERLLQEDVLAVEQCRLGQLKMRPHRCDDGYRIDVG